MKRATNPTRRRQQACARCRMIGHNVMGHDAAMARLMGITAPVQSGLVVAWRRMESVAARKLSQGFRAALSSTRRTSGF